MMQMHKKQTKIEKTASPIGQTKTHKAKRANFVQLYNFNKTSPNFILFNQIDAK